jgi:hypothetical protein
MAACLEVLVVAKDHLQRQGDLESKHEILLEMHSLQNWRLRQPPSLPQTHYHLFLCHADNHPAILAFANMQGVAHRLLACGESHFRVRLRVISLAAAEARDSAQLVVLELD